MSPPEILPFHRALVLPLERGFCCFSSVPVLMLIMPSIKIYIKSYNAAGSHASDQSPARAEMVKRNRKIICTWPLCADTGLISAIPKSSLCSPREVEHFLLLPLRAAELLESPAGERKSSPSNHTF